MKRLFWTMCAVLVLTMASGVALAQEEAGPEEGAVQSCIPENDANYESLGSNVTLEVTAAGDGGDLVALFATASNRFETSVERLDKRWLTVDGVITKDKDGGGYLVAYNVHVSRQIKSMEGWNNVSFYVKGSVLLKNGQKQVLGKSGDYTVTMKLKD